MRTLSTGHPSTLGSYRMLARSVLGEDSAAVQFLEDKIANSPDGADEEVIADESQMVMLLVNIDSGRAD